MERLHGERFETIRQAMGTVLAWLLWYNRQRMHSTLNYLSPAEFESRRENAGRPPDRYAVTEAGGGNMEIDQADSHIPTATTTTTR